MYRSFSQPNQAEKFIASGRIVLAVVVLFAIWLDLTDPKTYSMAVYYLLAVYLCYSIALALTVWRTGITWAYSAMVIHAFDLLLFAVLMFLTGGPASPFFVISLFLLTAATLRWQWTGVHSTAFIILVVEIFMVIYLEYLPKGPVFRIDNFIFNICYFLVATALLGQLGDSEKQQRSRASALANWPITIPEEFYSLLSNILQQCSLFFAGSRILLLWKDEENSMLHIAWWSSGQFHHSIESSDTFGSIVASSLAGQNFLCRNLLAPKPTVLRMLPAGVERWSGTPLNSELQRRFSIKSVLSITLHWESFSGRLFVFDKENMSSDDLVLGSVVAKKMMDNLEQFYMMKRLRQAATVEERINLARDLHDGILQSLTGVVLQLHTAHRLIENEPQAAQRLLKDIQILVSSEQQNLRVQIQQLKPHNSNLPDWNLDLATRLPELAERIEHQWGLQVDVDVNLHQSRLPGKLAHGAYFIIREAIINAARHAMASSVKVGISSTDHQLQIAITDDGQGFPFDGRRDHTELTENNLGPVILRERVTSLLGQLAIESGKTGAHLEITLPITEEMT
jgi:signal transduction histidine kinase